MSSSLFRKPLSGTRFGTGAYVKGIWQEGVASVIGLEASVQPTTAHDLLFLAIARRERKTYTLYTDFKLLALTAGQKNPDIVDINGERFEVTAEAPWQNNVISHFKYIVTLCQAIDDVVEAQADFKYAYGEEPEDWNIQGVFPVESGIFFSQTVDLSVHCHSMSTGATKYLWELWSSDNHGTKLAILQTSTDTNPVFVDTFGNRVLVLKINDGTSYLGTLVKESQYFTIEEAD
jgi:hypothetical protein